MSDNTAFCVGSRKWAAVSSPKRDGLFHKRDAIGRLAEFAARMRPAPTAPPAAEELKALVGRLRQLVAMLTAEKNRRQQAPRPIRERLDRTSRALNQWACDRQVRLKFIEPGKPCRNAFIESYRTFNSWLRRDWVHICLNEHVCVSLDDARRKKPA